MAAVIGRAGGIFGRIDLADRHLAFGFQRPAVGCVAIGVVAEQLLVGAFALEAQIVAFPVIGPFAPVAAIVEFGGGGAGASAAAFPDIGGGARLDGRAAVGGVTADIGVEQLACDTAAGKARIVALAVIGPVGGVVAIVDSGRGRPAVAAIGKGHRAGFVGGAAVGGVAHPILVDQLVGGAGAGEAGVVAFSVIGPFAAVVAEVDGGGRSGCRGGGAAILEGHRALLIGGAAVGGVAHPVFVDQFVSCAGAGEAGVIALAVIGPFGRIVTPFDHARRRHRGDGGVELHRACLIGSAAVGGVLEDILREQLLGRAAAVEARIVAFPVIGPFAAVVAEVDIADGDAAFGGGVLLVQLLGHGRCRQPAGQHQAQQQPAHDLVECAHRLSLPGCLSQVVAGHYSGFAAAKSHLGESFTPSWSGRAVPRG